MPNSEKKAKVAICQMPVTLGRPDLNTVYMEEEIKKAAADGVEIIIFPEMCVPGYLIGDAYEDESFVFDVLNCNERLRLATKDLAITAIFGSISAHAQAWGEDGRMLKSNGIFAAANGEWLYQGEKSLQPNYRMFDDDRHFCSKRKLRDRIEASANRAMTIQSMFETVEIPLATGSIIAGIIECEDMWDKDYPFSPTKILVEMGAELIINLSASPWTWQKNRKRHSVVKELLTENPVPFVYVNNTGVQNNGKNLVIFDGSSTVYNQAGDIALEVPPFFAGTETFDLSWEMPAIEPIILDDTTQLYQALRHGVKQFLWNMPPERRKMIIGLSGGIDSALAAAFYVDILGPRNVYLYNLPTDFNSDETKSIAAEIARNLGTHYEVVPIQGVVDAIAKATGCDPEKDELTYENIQARVRMEILAAEAQKLGGLFSCNSNKVEVAFGYGTMYGDIAGYLAAFGDLVKREVYQLADYFNRVVFEREIIPQSCFKIKPKAELKRDQKDPFDYGNLEVRGYHDEMVRAMTEFRWNPEKFVEKYVAGKLEKELKLEPGTLKRLFPNVRDFLSDLEKSWRLFFDAYRKRVQAPPIPIVTKRAFGFDLREALMSAHFTARYHTLRDLALKVFPAPLEIAVFGGSFNPPGRHHQEIAGMLTMFDKIVIVPCGARADKPSANIVPIEHRRVMALLAFPESERIKLDLHDFETGEYTPTYLLDRRYKELYPGSEIWHVIGEDIIAGGSKGESEIQRTWNRGPQIWETLNWAVLTRKGYGADKADLPPHHMLIEVEGVFGSGTLIRDRLKDGFAINDLVSPQVADYIYEHDLYLE